MLCCGIYYEKEEYVKMISKLLSNSPFLFMGGFVFLFSRFFNMMLQDPKDLKHTTGIVTKIWEPTDSSTYRAEVKFLSETGHTVYAKMVGLRNVENANEGDEIEIDYHFVKDGSCYATSNDPRYVSGMDIESAKKYKTGCLLISGLTVVLYIVLTVIEFIK